MAKYGTYMLERLVVKFCDNGGSSRGMRAFIREAMPALREENPQLQVSTVLRRNRHPAIVGLYRNGRSKPICVKNKDVDGIMEQVSWLRSSHGRTQDYLVVRSRHLTRNPSIQGTWSVDTFSDQLQRLTALRLERAQRSMEF